jgi:hypothetical protein
MTFFSTLMKSIDSCLAVGDMDHVLDASLLAKPMRLVIHLFLFEGGKG